MQEISLNQVPSELLSKGEDERLCIKDNIVGWVRYGTP